MHFLRFPYFSEFLKNYNTFTGIRLEFKDYICFQIMWNCCVEHAGIYLSSIARHACCGSFMLSSVVANTSCMHRKFKDDSTIAITIVIGAMVFVAGFIGAFQEARHTQANLKATSSMILRFKAAVSSKLTRLKVISLMRLRFKLGWNMYTFDAPQFLHFLQFLLDKVILFTLIICKK